MKLEINGMTSPVWQKRRGKKGSCLHQPSPQTWKEDWRNWAKERISGGVPIYPTTSWTACTYSSGSTPGPSCARLSQRSPPEQDTRNTYGCSRELLKRKCFRQRKKHDVQQQQERHHVTGNTGLAKEGQT